MNKKSNIFLTVLFLSLYSHATDFSYLKLYPDFVAACAVTQKKKINEKPEENWGHIVLFVNRTCLDLQQDNPRLKDCPSQFDGTWVSVNAMFKNTNWIAAEGWNFGLRGTLPTSNSRLTHEEFEKTKKSLISTKIFDRLQYHEKWIQEKPTHQSLVDYMAMKSLDMDFGITFGRNALCSFVPITPNQRLHIIEYLNRKNQEYQQPKNEFVWSPFHNNCAHLTYNSLSSIDLWDPKKTNSNPAIQIFNLGIPSEVLLSFSNLNENSDVLLKPQKLVQDQQLWRMFSQYSWLPYQHGNITQTFPVIANNDLYNTTNLDLFVLDWNPFNSRKKKLFESLKVDNSIHLISDLDVYEKKYRESLIMTESMIKNSQTQNRDRLQTLTQYLKAQLQDIELKRKILK